MTPEESKLWYGFLRTCPVRLLRQKVVDDYILDFYCSKVKLCIEIDGNHHLSIANREHDAIRSGKLSQYGITTIRFFNDQIAFQFEDVCKQIEKKVNEQLDKLIRK
jgi:very-short-patch-repair endonuclease